MSRVPSTPSLRNLVTEHAMRLTGRDDLVSRLLTTSPGGVEARSCVGRIVHDSSSALPADSPLGAWVSGSSHVSSQWADKVPAREDSLFSQLDFLALLVPKWVLADPCPYRRLEAARLWAADRARDDL